MEKSSRELVAELVHRYADAVVHRDGQQWGSCWAEDSRWILGPDRDVTGREAIVALWYKAMGNMEAVVQNVMNGEVQFAGDDSNGDATASGRWYIMEHFRRVNGENGILLAHYEDTFVRRNGTWLFASRMLVPHYQGAPDLSATFHNTGPLR